MEAELPYLELLFIEKMQAALCEHPSTAAERSIVCVCSAAPPVEVKAEDVEEEGDAAGAPAYLVPVDRMLYPSGVVPRIDNVMSHANLGCPVDLKRFARRVGNVVFDPKRHSALTIYFRRPKGTVQLYASGKAVCTGCKSEEASRMCIRKCTALVRRIGCSPNLHAFRVTNIFASCDTGFDIKLAHLARAHDLEYNTERSAKLTWHRADPTIVFEITSKGHVGLSGTTRVQELSTAFEQAYPALQAFGIPRDAVPTGPVQPSVPAQRAAQAMVKIV
jgi:transcription initiation factor TFIID TATA-box-binding protein